MIIKKLLAAFAVSLVLTSTAFILYIFAPLLMAAGGFGESSGIGSRSVSLGYFLIIEILTFAAVFAILQRRKR